jgi:DNA-directed RNA polymerase specialized sigma24 family protein
MTQLLTADMILEFHRSGRRGAAYLAIENGDIVHLSIDHVLTDSPEAYTHVPSDTGTEIQILLTQDTLRAGDWFPDALDDDGNLRPEVAAEMADIINTDAGLTLAAAIEAAETASRLFESEARAYERAARNRAERVARVVALCGGNQSEAARRLGLDQSTVNKLVRKARG